MEMNTSTAKSTNMILFWGCFIALVTTAFGFITRVFLIDTWSEAFDLNPAQAGRLTGIGIWPFFVSIVFFSLFIDRIGYKIAMIFAFIGHVSWGMLGYLAYQQLQVGHIDVAYDLLYWGSLIFALISSITLLISSVISKFSNASLFFVAISIIASYTESYFDKSLSSIDSIPNSPSIIMVTRLPSLISCSNH